MKFLKNNLIAVAFVAAALSAFAFKSIDPEPDPDRVLFAKIIDENNQVQWEPVTSDYECDLGSDICVAQFQNDIPMGTPSYQESGTFRQ